jgi:hypothetical protein
MRLFSLGVTLGDFEQCMSIIGALPLVRYFYIIYTHLVILQTLRSASSSAHEEALQWPHRIYRSKTQTPQSYKRT